MSCRRCSGGWVLGLMLSWRWCRINRRCPSTSCLGSARSTTTTTLDVGARRCSTGGSAGHGLDQRCRLTLVSSTPPTPHAGVYDKQTRRWYIATLRMTPEQNTTITVVASASSNPLGQYYAYDIDSNYAGKFPDKTCPPPHGCWSDFTTMGADANGIWCAPRARLLPRRAAARSWLPCCEGCAGAKQQAATWCRIAVDVLHDFTVMDYMVGRLLGPAAAGWWRLAGGEHWTPFSELLSPPHDALQACC